MKRSLLSVGNGLAVKTVIVYNFVWVYTEPIPWTGTGACPYEAGCFAALL